MGLCKEERETIIGLWVHSSAGDTIPTAWAGLTAVQVSGVSDVEGAITRRWGPGGRHGGRVASQGGCC